MCMSMAQILSQLPLPQGSGVLTFESPQVESKGIMMTQQK